MQRINPTAGQTTFSGSIAGDSDLDGDGEIDTVDTDVVVDTLRGIDIGSSPRPAVAPSGRGLKHARFERGDATKTGLSSGSFDAVVCVFGVFFVADMPGFVAEMWRMVRPGGHLAVTTWGAGWLEPASTVFWDSVRAVEPSLYKGFQPWDSITTVPAVEALFAAGGVTPIEAEAVSGAAGTRPA